MNKEFIKKIINKFGIDIYKHDDRYFRTTFRRPKFSKDIVVNYPDNMKNQKVAIIVQGVLKIEDDFTLESIKLYKRLYPKAIIILSTWKNENEKHLQKIRDTGIIVIENDKPINSGHGSINFQLKSTQVALNVARAKQCKYALKTRTDQRLYGEENITFLLQTLQNYPLNIDVSAKGRIITCSNGCFTGRLYNISDMVLFGYIDDLLAYFSCPVDERKNPEIEPGNDMIEYSKKRPGEIYFSTHYIERLGFKLKWTEKDSLFFIKELFIIVDNETLDWYWPKYTDSEYRWRDYTGRKLMQLTHKRWENLN